MENIKCLIENYLLKNKMRKVDLIRKTSYKKIAKGLRRLDDSILYGHCHQDFLTELSNAMEIDISVLENAIAATKSEIQQQEHEEERKNFKAHIEILHELKRPTGIGLLAFIGIDTFKIIKLPNDITSPSLWEEIETVREIILEHFKTKEGHTPFFGRVTGYRYFYKFEEWIEFSTDGEIKGYFSGSSELPKVQLKVGSKLIHGGMFNKFKRQSNPEKQNRVN